MFIVTLPQAAIITYLMTTGKPIITHFVFKDTNDVSGGDRRVIKSSSCHLHAGNRQCPCLQSGAVHSAPGSEVFPLTAG